MRLRITHLKAPWPLGAVAGDVLDLPSIPAWAAGKCEQVDGDVELTIGVLLNEEGGDTVTGDGAGESLPVIDEPVPEAPKAKGKK